MLDVLQPIIEVGSIWLTAASNLHFVKLTVHSFSANKTTSQATFESIPTEKSIFILIIITKKCNICEPMVLSSGSSFNQKVIKHHGTLKKVLHSFTKIHSTSGELSDTYCVVYSILVAKWRAEAVSMQRFVWIREVWVLEKHENWIISECFILQIST